MFMGKDENCGAKVSSDSNFRLGAPALPLLITGVAGVTGYNALGYFQSRFPGQVIGIRQQNNWRLNTRGAVACNAEDRGQLLQLFDRYQFRSVLNCAGNCALRACELDSRLAWRTNVEGLTNLLSIAVDRSVRLVHTSIDLVFSGWDPEDIAPGNGYVETDSPDPVTVYGKTMVAAEQLLADWMPAAGVLRISLPMGVSFNGHAGAIDWIQSRFKKGRPATLYYDEVRSPTYTDCLNRLIHRVLTNSLAGMFHAGGPLPLSLFEIAQIVNRVGGYEPDLLMGCPRIEAGPIPPRAGNVTLDSSKLERALGYAPFDRWPLDETHIPTDRQWHHCRHEMRRQEKETAENLLARVLYRNPRYGDCE
jgi:dTDP-4-dehydrorhamnose reductase